jgi:ABC-2 type transport system permease protein
MAPIDKRESTPTEVILKNARIKEVVTIFSPMELYSSASGTIIDPMRKTTKSLIAMGALEELSSSRFQNPLSLGQSVLVVYPHMVALIAISLICFAITYTVFMVQEIRT